VRVDYWEPTLLVNTETFHGLGPAVFGARFHEARVWPFPLLAVDPAGCLFPCRSQTRLFSAFTLTPYYLSDIDPLWRTGDLVPNPAGLAQSLGTWGPLSPRSGWGSGGSDPATSALAFYRAVDIAANPGSHIVIAPSGVPATTGNKINLGYPKLTRCLRPGAPQVAWEQGAGSPTGHYLWVYWVRRQCCLDPAAICSGGMGGLISRLGSLGPVLCGKDSGGSPAGAQSRREEAGPLALLSAGAPGRPNGTAVK
jgi:hypothetical protein